MNMLPIGPSTKAVWVAAIGAALAFVIEWAQSGTAPAWLAGISGILLLANNAFRSWASVKADGTALDASTLVADPPAEPTDSPVA